MAKDNRSIDRTIRFGAVTFAEDDRDAPDRLQEQLTPEEGQRLLDRGALSGEGWEFTGTRETVEALSRGAAGTTAREPEGAPGARGAQPAGRPAAGGAAATGGLRDMTRRELEAEMDRRGLDLNDVTGTGAGGNVLVSDLVAYLERNPGTPAGATPAGGAAGTDTDAGGGAAANGAGGGTGTPA